MKDAGSTADSLGGVREEGEGEGGGGAEGGGGTEGGEGRGWGWLGGHPEVGPEVTDIRNCTEYFWFLIVKLTSQ